MSKKDDVKFHSPIPYHKVIEELSDTIFEKFVNDERSNDKFLETPALQDFVKRFEQDSSMYSEEDEMNQMIVRQMGIYLVAQLICQISVFGRPIMFKERWVGNQLLDMWFILKTIFLLNTNKQQMTEDKLIILKYTR